MIIRDEKAKKILEKEQRGLAPLLEEFSTTHILVGGTAISLQLGHRKSINFDLFTFGSQGTGRQLATRIQKTGLTLEANRSNLLWLSDEEQAEATVFINGVKVQLLDFSRNPFNISISIKSNLTLCNGIPSLDLLTLGAMKCYALMYRTKIKDAIDIYFIIQSGISLESMIQKAQEIFKDLYKPEYTYEALTVGERDTTEEVEYIIPNPPTFNKVQTFLLQATDSILKKQIT